MPLIISISTQLSILPTNVFGQRGDGAHDRSGDQTDETSQHYNHDGFDNTGHTVNHGVHLLFVEVSYLYEHHVDLARLFADRHHLADYRREEPGGQQDLA